MTELLSNAVTAATPLIFVALGGLIAERAGILSISLEGYMLTGAFAAVAISHTSGIWAGLAAAAIAGGLIALAHAFLCISARLNQIISGLALNLFALGITGFLNSFVFGEGQAGTQVPGFSPLKIPGLSSIPVVGPALFDQPPFTYAAVPLAIAVSFFFWKMRPGLTLHAVGEHPAAAETRGVPVFRYRYLAVVTSGALAGIGGAALSIGILDSFTDNMTAGRGYIALAAIVFAGWRPLWAVGACLLFGLADAAQVSANALNINVPFELLATAPYVVTIIALIILGRRGRAPGGLGIPYLRGAR
ncbi:MAG: ABC transporter permease [Actinobacteria bacterium]|nr:ABC transporter permease [Actinomycetota bacterium]